MPEAGVDDPISKGRSQLKKTSIPPRRYLQKIDEFLTHWPLVNTALGAPVVLTGNYAVAQLTADRAALNTQVNLQVTAENASQAAIADRDIKRAALKERIRQFNAAVRGFFPGTTYAAQLPRVPNATAPLGEWAKAMQDVADIWAQINAILPVPVGAPIPLVLTGAYARATFITDQTAMLAAFTTIESTQLLAQNARLTRDGIWYPVYLRLKQYRLAVQGRFATGAPLLEALPAITPPSGHTPAAVDLSAAWDNNILKAVITFTASPDPSLSQYELRACFGATYKTDEEQVIGNLPGSVSPLRFQTDAGLVASGSKVLYKVYVILSTGNEKGSRTVNVVRP